jgi:FixJ family two-component response regulator
MQTTAGSVAVVEDDAAMRRSIEYLLIARGYTVSTFESAEAFLESAAIGSAVGLVLDIHLPGMSGIDLQTRLLAMKSRMQVVFVTAYDDDAVRLKALALGCVDFLQKPFDSSRLVQALERAMSS